MQKRQGGVVWAGLGWLRHWLVVLHILAGWGLVGLVAQTAGDGGPVLLHYDVAGSYQLTERSDWARYDNGKYTGHVYREVRASLSPQGYNEYRGTCYVLEETLHDQKLSAQALDAVYPVAFRMASDGTSTPIEDHGYPSLRGFPVFPRESVSKGQKWTAAFTRAVDPRHDGAMTFMNQMAEFEYRGQELYKDQPVHRIFAKYATRYRDTRSQNTQNRATSARDVRSRLAGGSDQAASTASPLVLATGSHDVDILVSVQTGNTVLIRDRLDETFTFADASTVRFKGFTLLFTQGSLGAERAAVVAKLKGNTLPPGAEVPPVKPPAPIPVAPPTASAPLPAEPPVREVPDVSMKEAPFELADAGGAKNTGIIVEETPAGVRLSVRDLRFEPDSAQLLTSEKSRLETLAASLKQIPGRTFLVEGHTAAVGKAAGEAELSKKRAKAIVDELVARGIPAASFLYTGWGGTKPVAANDSEEGRAQNRRVEITILD